MIETETKPRDESAEDETPPEDAVDDVEAHIVDVVVDEISIDGMCGVY